MLLVIMGNFQGKTNSDASRFKELAANTPFSAKQLKEWHAEFMQDCPSGQMDKQTFIQNFGEHFFPADGNTLKLAEYVFKRFDVNKDGAISFEEFINAVSIPARGNIDEKLDLFVGIGLVMAKVRVGQASCSLNIQGCFSIYDIDEDGFITTDEMKNVIKAIFRRRNLRLDIDSKVGEIFARMDVNKDGVLSKDEFIRGFKTDPQILSALVAEQCSTSDSAIKNKENNKS